MKRRNFLKTIVGGTGLGLGTALLTTTKNSTANGMRNPAFSITNYGQYSINIGPGTDEVIRFAAQELQKYIKKISNISLEINTPPILGKENTVIITSLPSNVSYLERLIAESKKLREDGFMLKAGEQAVVMTGTNSRGALYAMYAFLEKLGCRFYGLGETGEIIPVSSSIDIPDIEIKEEPSFRRRDFTEDSGYAIRLNDPDHIRRLHDYWMLLADWFGKNRINTVNDWHFQNLKWVGNDVKDHSLWNEFKKRGITMWTGGHIIPMLMPRELFTQYPDYFRMDQTGKRVQSGNFCPSNKTALELVVKNAVQYIKDRPWADNLNVWGEDVWEGSWCFCPECKKMTVQDQYITTCNAIAKAIKDAGINVEVACIAYHDSIEPDLTIQPEPNLRLFWAPRERAYGFATNDMRSERNQWYAACLEKHANLFGPHNIDIFDYYTDNILFRTFPISIPHVIAQDTQYYTDLGFNNRFMMLSLGDYSWQSEPLNINAFARLSYNRNLDVDEMIADYCKTMYGPAASTMILWHNDFENGISYTATFGDIQRVPTEATPRTEKLMIEIRLALETLKRTNLLVKRAKSETSNQEQQERIRIQGWINEFAIKMTEGLLNQVKGNYYLAWINEIIWDRKADNQDPFKGMAGRYIQVKETFQEAIKQYEDATAFIRALPERDKTVWLITSFYNHNKGICDVMRAIIAECDKHIQ